MEAPKKTDLKNNGEKLENNKNLQAVKGHTNNPNGRPKGVPNKVTADLRQWITDFLQQNLKQIKKDWKQLGPKDRLILFEKLLKYTIPILQESDLRFKYEDMTDEQLREMLDDTLRKLEYLPPTRPSSTS